MAARSQLANVVAGLVVAALFGRGWRSAPAPRPEPRPAVVAVGVTAAPASGARVHTGSELVEDYRAAGRPAAARGRLPRVAVAHTLVVVLPDPLDSHLDWAFDSEIESVRRAFEAADYVLDRYWLPWTPATDGGRATAAGDSLRTGWPGVMLFRRTGTPDSLAVAYLVGEIPTRGVHVAAFAAALRDRRALLDELGTAGDSARVTADSLRIVGPTFSGSSRSLRNALDAARDSGLVGATSIVSGGATSLSNATVLRTPAGQANGIDFHATVNPVDLLKHRIQAALHDGLGIPEHEIAYLAESGTQFGFSLRDSSHATPAPARVRDTMVQAPELDSALQLPFPMNISRLRREYSREVLPSDTIGRGQPSLTRLDWRDPASEAESPAPLSQLSAPMIERTLADIEQTLTLHHIRAVGILATDVRDRLFIASIVKERLHDVKVFFIGSHSLYLRPELNQALRGSLVVSTYPLFIENQFWDLSHRGRDRLVFTSDLSEGTYNAALAQLARPDRMTDYGVPGDRRVSARPPVWITTVGAASLLPVLAIADTNPAGDAGAYVLARGPLDMRAVAESDDGVVEPALLLIVLALALGAALVWHARDCRGRMHQFQPPAPHDDAVGRAQRELWEHQHASLGRHLQSWAFLRAVAIVSAFATLALVLQRTRVHGAVRSLLPLGWAAGFLVLPCLGSLAAHRYQLRRHAGSGPTGEHVKKGRTQHVVLWLLAGAYLALNALFLYQIGTLGPVYTGIFFLRALAFSSGVTPVVPLLVGALLIVAWATWHLDRMTLLSDMPAFEAACRAGLIDTSSVVPSSALGSRSQFEGATTRVREGLLKLVPTPSGVGVLAGLAAVVAWVLQHFDRSLETVLLSGVVPEAARFGPSGTFDWLFRLLVVTAVSLGTWTLYRLLVVWGGLRECLRNVEAIPLGTAFGRLPRSIAGVTRFTPFNAPAVDAVRLSVDRAAAARWRELCEIELPADVHTRLCDAGRDVAAWPRLRSPRGSFVWSLAAPVAALHVELCAAAAAGTLPIEIDEPTADEKSRATPPPRRWGDVAQELVALYVLDYVEWVVRHLRHLALSLVASLALTTVFLSCYPFEPSSLVKVFFFALMATSVAAIATLLLQMNRDATLSRMTRTTPGQVTWDTQLVLNLALVAGVPLVTLLGAEFPQVREFLFSWVTPALKAVGKG